MSSSSHVRADLVLLLVTLIAAAGWIFSKEALTGLPPLLFIGVRFLMAGLVLFGVGRSGWGRVVAAGLRLRALALGGVMTAALLCWIQGLARGEHLGEGAFITSLGVVLVPLMAWLVHRERAPLSTWLSLPVAVLGLGLLSLEGGFRLAPGEGWFLSAALLFSLHFTLMARVAAAVPAVILTAVQLLVVGAGGLCASALLEPWPATVAAPVVGWLLASALVASSLRFALQTYGQGLAPASHVALIMTLEPVWTALLGGLWYGEAMSPVQLSGCALIFGATLISRWRWVRGLLRPLTLRRGKTSTAL